MFKINFSILLLFLLCPFFFFSQNKTTNKIFNIESKKKAITFKKEIHFNKAQYYFEENNWDSTLVYSMKHLSSSGNKELNDYCHYFRGFSLNEKKLFTEAKSELKLISKDFTFYPLVNKVLGEISLQLKEFEKAIEYFNAIEKYPYSSKQGFKVSTIYQNIGVCYLHLNKFKKAEEYLFKSKKIGEQEKDNEALIYIYMNIANLYYLQYQDAKAIPYFEKAYLYSKKTKNFDKKESTAFNMAMVEENKGDLKKALEYRKEAEQWKDSVHNQNKIWAVADFEKKFAVAQKQKEIKVLQVENKLKNTQRNALFFSAIALLLILTGGVYLYAQRVKSSKIILRQKNKLDELNATKDQLFSIVSHDLRSSVNALKSSNSKLSATLETKNYDELNQLIVQNSSIANGTYSLLDNLLHWALLQTKQLYFHKESIHLHSVIQQIAYNYKPLLLEKAITFENLVSKSIFLFVDLDSLKIVFRNLLDNAIKFSKENGQITFSANEIDSDYCQVIIQDKGIGMSRNTIDELLQEGELLAKKGNSEIIGTGLGLQLCKQMIKKNSGTFEIESELNKGTKMILTFPKTK
ncbi:tetratricopeptide repeat-containing sensor histidine kinase [Flavobacterium johnsoniae]|jgi:signal transduction histidine kinase|uniref:histidine kinase n=1 Tax=Flavobacterium johnsoniae (strain ATCC 17061 / DSM 2064 / JCM 8514 / BCRC 14874 / CCUG 350202 / NBRC 14942 / NCIMB 11054 / UW101) TaxID=376686 RepID=A5FJY9_FLAJ1|nr:ATP-binding protein [Flavobacterium johnsoniae]ABQ04474.1 integral membrane sensor signal transduction histidine kinase [Flavobacterium johnsoniae UW101]OXE97800.1 ATP-binding protein [Flavobacterium johnsoniae UW101]WQG83730.1 ATP-binding protein [Flavobacterium johnsoniae UW101]SHK23408.1 Signal transduction histidine kinase [Flavobacterium johnsoniae]